MRNCGWTQTPGDLVHFVPNTVRLYFDQTELQLWKLDGMPPHPSTPDEAPMDQVSTTEVGVAMFLQYYVDEKGDRVYTLKKACPNGQPTSSAHPARFSPDDKFSRHRVMVKKRFGILLTQQPRPVL
ncbi:hypothetical protein INR49_002457 [Caranx melampygus]|nr:hypothetical protein INR49_002457 [Caranx melampygus]